MSPRSRRAWCAWAALAAALLPASGVAAGARRPGLAGNLLIEDQDDVFAFPHELIEYRNLIALSYGASASTGNGLLTLGNDSLAFGVALHRGDVLGPHAQDELSALAGPDGAFPEPLTLGPATMLDLLMAIGDRESQLGVRASVGAAEDALTTAGSKDSQTNTFVMAELSAGRGIRGQGIRMDGSLAVTLDFGDQQLADQDLDDGTSVALSLLQRGYFPIDGALDLGMLSDLSATSTTVNGVAPGEPSRELLGLSVGGGVGPALRLGGASVAGYAVIHFRVERDDPNTDASADDSAAHSIAVPGVHIAVEVPIASWFVLRSGAQYAFEIDGTNEPDDNANSRRTGSFSWNLGFGLSTHDLRFDASLQHGFVTSGPDFLGGSSPGFLAIASLSYSFDAARRAAAKGNSPAAEPPKPAAEPPPSPAPVQAPTAVPPVTPTPPA